MYINLKTNIIQGYKNKIDYPIIVYSILYYRYTYTLIHYSKHITIPIIIDIIYILLMYRIILDDIAN